MNTNGYPYQQPSGKGGAAFVLQHAVGYRLPREMHPEFGNIVKAARCFW
ncbi:MAG: hypothetical protein ACLR2G_08170 [Phascolarctobacterium faecium]